jgi:Bacterial Ig-like domain
VRRVRGFFGLLSVLFAAGVLAQPGTTRVATNAESLVGSAVFFNSKQIAVRRDIEEAGRLIKLAGTAKPVYVFWAERPSVTSNSEIRGEFWDLGRLEKTDTRLSNIDVQSMLDAAPGGQWPAHEQIFLILKATSVDSPLPDEPTIRALALAPDKYIGKGVTVTGRFRGANLLADLPTGAGTKGRWDFVLQSADAAIWVSGVRPRGKGFDLDVNSRMDTGRWLRVAGTLRRDGPLPWIEANSLQAVTAPQDTTFAGPAAPPPPPPQPSPEVIFTAPTLGDTDVERGDSIRLQFSHDMDARTFAGHVRVSYAGPPTEPGGPATPPAVTVRYIEGTRAIEIKPATPFDRFRQVKVDLLDGILSAVDGKPLAPWSLTFTTGG